MAAALGAEHVQPASELVASLAQAILLDVSGTACGTSSRDEVCCPGVAGAAAAASGSWRVTSLRWAQS